MATGSASVFVTRAGISEYQFLSPDVAEVFVLSRPIEIVSARDKKHVRRILHKIVGAESSTYLKVELYWLNEIDDDPTLYASEYIRNGNPIKVRMPSARYVVVGFRDTRVDYSWELFGFELWGTLTSRRF